MPFYLLPSFQFSWRQIAEYEIIPLISDCHISKRLFRTLENVVWNNTREKYSEFVTSHNICKLLHLKLKFKVFIDLLEWLNYSHNIHFRFSVKMEIGLCLFFHFQCCSTYFHSACSPAFIADMLWQGGKIMGIFGASLTET